MNPRDFTMLLEDAPQEMRFFYGLKSLLDDGDGFEVMRHKPFYKNLACEFTYKGTRRVQVYFALFGCHTGDGTPQDATVVVYDMDTNTTLDSNVFHNPQSTKYELSWDPRIQTPPQLVAYVRSVLDRDDRNGSTFVPPASSSPAKQPKLVTA